MLPSNNIQSIVGATLYGRDKVKIGRIDQVLVDAADGHPTWAVLHGGVFGRKNLFVPLDDATWEDDDVFVALDKDDVKHAPHPDADGGLAPDEEQELRAYYTGHRAEETGAERPAAGLADADADADADAHKAADAQADADSLEHADAGPKHAVDADSPDVDESVVLVQERLVVRTEQVPVATVNLDAVDDLDTNHEHPAETASTPDSSTAATELRDDDPDDHRPGPDRIVI